MSFLKTLCTSSCTKQNKQTADVVWAVVMTTKR